jgi:hypothetical protein
MPNTINLLKLISKKLNIAEKRKKDITIIYFDIDYLYDNCYLN